MQLRPYGSRGFILMDVVLGMLILTIAVLAIGGLYFQNHRTLIFADNRTVAYDWAQQRIEYLKSDETWKAAFASKGTQPTDKEFNDHPSREGFTMATSVSWAGIDWQKSWPTPNIDKDKLKDAINSHLIAVTVTVSYKEGDRNESAVLWTLIDYYGN